MTQAIEWVAYQGRTLYGPDGNVIGTIEEFYIDCDDGEPESDADHESSKRVPRLLRRLFRRDRDT